ncbi:MAG: macro domain-containing protein [bacterium]
MEEIYQRIQIIQGDITEEKVDAIVNPANTDLILGAGVSGAIKNKAGFTIIKECKAHGPVPLGGAAVTSAGKLPARLIIHAAVMHWGGKPSEQSIADATTNALKAAFKRSLESISFPALGTGVGGFPMEKAAEIILRATLDFISQNTLPKYVRFVLLDAQGVEIFKETLNRLKSERERVIHR